MSHFHLSDDLVLLFNKWRGTTLSDHLKFGAAVFVVSVVNEFLRAYMKYQISVQARQRGRHTFTALAASFIYQISFILGYVLMLVVMLYSTILFVATVLGAGVGYFIAQPTYGMILDHAEDDIYYVKQTKAKKLTKLETQTLDTRVCPPEHQTYV